MNNPITKHLSITGLACLTVFLPALLIQPADLQAGLSFFVKFGAGYGGQTQSYNGDWTYSLYGENGTLTGAYKLDTKGLVLEPGLGVYFTPNIGLEILFVPVSKSGTANFTASVPHPFYFGHFRSMSWSATDLAYSGSELDVHLLGRLPLLEGKLGVYAFAGLAYFLSVKVTSLSDVAFDEAGYPYTSVSAVPAYTEYSKGVLGFSLGGGVDYLLVKDLGVYVGARYAMGTAKLDVGHGAQIEIKPGGLRLTAGLKYSFGI